MIKRFALPILPVIFIVALFTLSSMAVENMDSKTDETIDSVETFASKITVSDRYLASYTADTSKLKICKYESCFVPDFSDQEYESRMKKMKSNISLVFNSDVKGYIRMYTMKRRTLATRIIGRSYDYFPKLEAELKRQKMPIELRNLAIVESALNMDALSKCGALGLWQFMPATARMYKLKVNEEVDERKDLDRATVAALKFLNDLHATYHDWLLAIAAYNCGNGNVNKAIKKGRSHDFWKIKKYLPEETRGYVPAFIAMCYVMNYYHDHNLKAVDPQYISADMTPVELKKNTSFRSIAKFLPMTPEELVFFNPDIEVNGKIEVKDSLPTINIPTSLYSLFKANESQMYDKDIAEAFPIKNTTAD